MPPQESPRGGMRDLDNVVQCAGKMDRDDLIRGPPQALVHGRDLALAGRLDRHGLRVLGKLAQEGLMSDADPFLVGMLADADGERHHFDAQIANGTAVR